MIFSQLFLHIEVTQSLMFSFLSIVMPSFWFSVSQTNDWPTEANAFSKLKTSETMRFHLSWFNAILLFLNHSIANKLSCSSLLIKNLYLCRKHGILCHRQSYKHQCIQEETINHLSIYWKEEDRKLIPEAGPRSGIFVDTICLKDSYEVVLMKTHQIHRHVTLQVKAHNLRCQNP